MEKHNTNEIEWGLRIDQECTSAIGFRAIYSRGRIMVLPDRVSSIAWNERLCDFASKCIEEMQSEFMELDVKESEDHEFRRERDGMVFIGNPKQSFGYVYGICYENKEE